MLLLFFKIFLAVVTSILRSRVAVELENLALRHQIGVLQRSAAKCPKLTSGDRLFWTVSLASGATGARRWPSSIQKPSWLGIAPRFDASGPGRCGAVYLDDPHFVRGPRSDRKMCRENPLLGAPR